MGFDAFIDFMLTFFPLKQMERMRNAISTHTADSKKDLENIQESFMELLPWLGAKYQYYRLLLPSAIALMDKRQMDGISHKGNVIVKFEYEDGEIYRGLEDFIETAMSRKFHTVFDKERVRKVLGDLTL